MPPAIILSSGGLDSTTCLAIAKAERFAPLYSLSFDYGQRHRHELDAAARVAKQFNVAEHRVIRIDLRQFGKSALTDDIAVPRSEETRLNSSHLVISYAVFCLKKKKTGIESHTRPSTSPLLHQL